MFAYWILFLVPVYLLFARGGGGTRADNLVWRLFGLFLIVLIGLRHQVGGDWFAYLDGLEIVENSTLEELLNARVEVGYNLISQSSQALGASIYGVNLICAAIFTYGLISLSRAQPFPWLAMVVAVPYLVIVVAMGYTRQATAIGLLMLAFGYLLRGRLTAYLVLVVLAGLFHKTALIFAAFPLFRPGGGYFRLVLGVVLLASLTGGAFLVEAAESFMLHYVEQNMESGGGQIRVLMNLPPALLVFAYWKEWGEKYKDRWLWGLMALLAIVCVPLVSIASTAVDRMALYLIPLQLIVWARLPALMRGRIQRTSIFLMVIFFYAVVEFIWLVFGTFASHWIPYDNLLFPSF